MSSIGLETKEEGCSFEGFNPLRSPFAFIRKIGRVVKRRSLPPTPSSGGPHDPAGPISLTIPSGLRGSRGAGFFL